MKHTPSMYIYIYNMYIYIYVFALKIGHAGFLPSAARCLLLFGHPLPEPSDRVGRLTSQQTREWRQPASTGTLQQSLLDEFSLNHAWATANVSTKPSSGPRQEVKLLAPKL